MANKLVTHVTAGSIQDLLREMGWNAQLAGSPEAPQIVSSASGVNFSIHFATKAKGKPGWTDLTISAPFTLDQQVSPVIGGHWNRRNRFARVYRTQTQLFLDMDVIVAGGVTDAFLKYQFALWADMVRLFLRHLRADHEAIARHDRAPALQAGEPIGEAGPRPNGSGKPKPGAQATRTARTGASQLPEPSSAGCPAPG